MVSTRSYHNCCTVEKLIMQALGEPLNPGQLSALTKALDTILERKRILRMRPTPKPIDVQARRKPSAPAPSITYADPAPVQAPLPAHT